MPRLSWSRAARSAFSVAALALCGLASGEGVQITRPPQDLEVEQVSPSPDGNWIAIQCAGERPREHGLWLVNLRSGLLSELPNHAPAGSPPHLGGWDPESRFCQLTVGGHHYVVDIDRDHRWHVAADTHGKTQVFVLPGECFVLRLGDRLDLLDRDGQRLANLLPGRALAAAAQEPRVVQGPRARPLAAEWPTVGELPICSVE